ncbi:c-type cytochrome [Sphingobium chungbukense]|uniref:Cytochrome C n=1 Tax=Sphingobium chungbukense TaxID=56193 RepID=A0A0M3AT98_9SPHN|nr:cytochrome c [Sphingobium chungbukense]KKW91739.1 cytochrome C [Sphingobium chungbukense]
MWKAAIAISLSLAGVATMTAAGNAGDVSRGRELAERCCASCHAIGEADKSPDPLAPPFRNLYRQYPVDALQPAFLKGLEVGHRNMPRFVLSPQEVTDIIAFLHDLNPCGKPSSDDEAMARCFAPVK